MNKEELIQTVLDNQEDLETIILDLQSIDDHVAISANPETLRLLQDVNENLVLSRNQLEVLKKRLND